MIDEQNGATSPTDRSVAAQLEAISTRGLAMPADMEARLRQRFEAALGGPAFGLQAGMARRLLLVAVTVTVLWTLYLSFLLQRAQGGVPGLLHSQPVPHDSCGVDNSIPRGHRK